MVHWRADPSDIRRQIPDSLLPDVVDGSAWISLVALSIDLGHGDWARKRPKLFSMPQTNLRTYVRSKSGRDGLWFLSLDVPRRINVLAGRMIGLPYHLSEMRIESVDGQIRYRCSRRGGKSVGHDFTAEPGREMSGDQLPVAEALAGRWRAYAGPRAMIENPVEHEPWTLCECRIAAMDESLLEASGLGRPAGDALVSYAEEVHARLGAPRLTRRSG